MVRIFRFYFIFQVSFLLLFISKTYADLSNQLDQLVESLHRTKSFNGNLLIKHKGEIVFEKSIGNAVEEWQVPHTMKSKFMIASLSKSFTSALILILHEQNKLKVTDEIYNYINLPKGSNIDVEKWRSISIQDLMQHKSGLIRDFKPALNLNRSGYNLLSHILQNTLTNDGVFLTHDDGSYHYSNFGYLILAAVAEKAGVHFYHNQLKYEIFDPLNLKNTGEFHRHKFIENMSDGYFYGENRTLRKRCCDDSTSLRGAASLYSDAYDLMAWLDMLSGKSPHPNFPNLHELMLENISEAYDEGYAYGLAVHQHNNRERVYHNGHEFGYVSSISFYPEEDLQIVALSNRHGFISYSDYNVAADLSLKAAEIILN
jgi:CubicO group peptidase (beta-lactamase class C family)